MRKVYFKFTGFPTKNESMVVPNPKDIVTKALPDIPGLITDMKATMLDLMLAQWYNGTSADAAQAYSMPVFMLMQAVENMAEAKKLGTQEKQQEEEEEKRKKDFILLIVSVALMVSSKTTQRILFLETNLTLSLCLLSARKLRLLRALPPSHAPLRSQVSLPTGPSPFMIQ